VKGVLLTDWGDGGHWQQLPVSYLGYAWSAALSWSLTANRSIDLRRALDRFAFRDATGTLGRLAWDLGNTYLKPGFRRGNSSILYWFYTETLAGMRRNWPTFIRYGPNVFQDDKAVLRGMHETIEWIDSVCAPLARVEDELVRREFAHGAALARHAARRVLVELGEPGRETLQPELDAIVAELIALWPRRNRPGGMSDSAQKLVDSKAHMPGD
jgi:hexosaminidase